MPTEQTTIDSARRVTKFADISTAERREYTIKREGLERPSSIVWYFDCPFCGDEIKAFLWSLSGGGKRCNCGALFGSGGRAYKRRPPTTQKET